MGYIGLRKPPAVPVRPALKVGDAVPALPQLQSQERRWLIAVLRHIGCLFAENMVRELRAWAEAHPEVAVFAVGHGDQATTDAWLRDIGGLGRIRRVNDEARTLYADWGLGFASFWHFASLASIREVMRLRRKGIRNRSAASTRFQRSGMFLVDGQHLVWVDAPDSVQDLNFPPN